MEKNRIKVGQQR